MSSGSYFTIYRKHIKSKVDQATLDALKNEYYLSNKDSIFSSNVDDAKLKEDMPLLLNAKFSHRRECSSETDKCMTYYDANGYVYDKLLEFWFGSSFSCLRDSLNLNRNTFNRCSTFISKVEAKQMLQAIEYVLSGKYSREFEDILNNEYVDIFGEGYSRFDNRFNSRKDPIYIDKNNDGYCIHFGDYQCSLEIVECDDEHIISLKRARVCLLAFLEAEESSWNDEEIVLEYSVY